MGQIIAYFGTDADDKVNRQAGMKLLGDALIASILGEPSVLQVHTAINTMHGIIGMALHFQNSDTAAGTRGLRISAVNPPNGNKFICDLVDTANAAAGELTIQFGKDKDKDKTHGNPANHTYELNVMFPELADNGAGFAYIRETVDDVEAILNSAVANPKSEAVKYLAAFKFLSRCK